jgi:hypothetical protein
MDQPKTIKIDEVEYVRKDSNQKAFEMDGMPYCIVRTQSAGVFAGYIEKRVGKEVIIRQARRLWYWSGACSLSQLAVDGIADPKNCKFPEVVNKIEVMEAIEILEVTGKAKTSIEGVPVWKK